ncbi:zinc ABC transporter substrate-binding protein ZnuA [Parendozoicomonas sp. Alg238-R29]|uniref:zinc ABC transporter substrate-binding protein ZnuA n=1 Tax=Parendozoicomonas sp. Alg238-R29 TaxID=2993446 RepID=UPI00248E284E|nr:zinc ABC transporter substrate-binding protein ZnuA [Parendozoicomonas sp. Alg238-R29]
MLISPVSIAKEEPKVLVSIKPLELIATAITDGVTTPELILQPGTSPHDYSLKPSDIKNLASADLVFWIGEDLEGFLATPLDRYVGNTYSIAMMDAPNVKVERFLSADREDVQQKMKDMEKGHNGYGHNGHGHNHEGHDHGSHDPHIWLSPDNAIAMARAMMQALSEVDKPNAETYQANYLSFVDLVKKSDSINKQVLNDLHQKGFFIFHDAWGYFTRHYDLKVLDVFTLSPEQQPGARHMLQLRNKLKKAGKTCVFREPQFEPAYLDAMINGLPVRVAVIDPLASDVQPHPRAYPEFLEQLSISIRDCLTPQK